MTSRQENEEKRKNPSKLVRTSDVVVILVGFFVQFLQYDKDIQLSVDFGVSDNRRLININDCFKHLGKVKSLALPFFHAFSCCDSTALFYKKSKMSVYISWVKSQCCHEITEAFKQLSWLPMEKEIEKNLPVICIHFYTFTLLEGIVGINSAADPIESHRIGSSNL